MIVNQVVSEIISFVVSLVVLTADYCFGFEGDFHNHYTPNKYGALQRHPIEGPVSEGFNFASSVVMVWHLCNNTKLNNQVSISLCACFTHSPNQYINVALKRVGQYLK